MQNFDVIIISTRIYKEKRKKIHKFWTLCNASLHSNQCRNETVSWAKKDTKSVDSGSEESKLCVIKRKRLYFGAHSSKEKEARITQTKVWLFFVPAKRANFIENVIVEYILQWQYCHRRFRKYRNVS